MKIALICVGAGLWQYADAPLNLTTQPKIVVGLGNVTTPVPTGGSSKK